MSAVPGPSELSRVWPPGAVTRTRGAPPAPSRRMERVRSPFLIVTANEPPACAAAALPSNTSMSANRDHRQPSALMMTSNGSKRTPPPKLTSSTSSIPTVAQAPIPTLEIRVYERRQMKSATQASMSWPKLKRCC